MDGRKALVRAAFGTSAGVMHASDSGGILSARWKMSFRAATYVLAMLSLSGDALVAQGVPSGTILPAQLSKTIDSCKAQAGERISARLMQDVQFGPNQRLKSGTRLTGRIVSTDPHHVTLAFDRIVNHHQTIPIRTDLRSLASMMAVQDAQLPTNDAGGDRGSSIADWNTVQVGGQAVYGRGGDVYDGNYVVGHSLLSGGVLAVPQASTGCRGEVGNHRRQAFWIFSSDACGAYGFDDLTIVHAGRTAPAGQIVLSSPSHVLIRAGSGLLLRVIGD